MVPRRGRLVHRLHGVPPHRQIRVEQAVAAQPQLILQAAELLPQVFSRAFRAGLLAHSTVPMALKQKFPWHFVAALAAGHRTWPPVGTAAKVRLDQVAAVVVAA